MNLIERVEAGETEREVDAEVARLLGFRVHSDGLWLLIPSGMQPEFDRLVPLPAFTRGIDSHISLPGRIKLAQRLSYPHATIQRWEAVTDDDVQGTAPTECGARLAALLRGMG